MPSATEQVIDLIFGRWRCQFLAAGTELGVFDRLDLTNPRTAPELAVTMAVDPVRPAGRGCIRRLGADR
jgi:hypothetical protein